MAIELKQQNYMLSTSGQSTVEFLLSFIYSIGFIFLFVQLAINSTAGFLTHYAVFMSSRTYLVKDNGSIGFNGAETYAKNQAKEVIKKYELEKFKINSANLGFYSNEELTTRDKKIYIGTYLLFKQKLSPLKLLLGNKAANLVSESFLGKEVTRYQCFKRVCEVMKFQTEYATTMDCESPGSIDKHVTLFDNGC
jgi:hypothetical protein